MKRLYGVLLIAVILLSAYMECRGADGITRLNNGLKAYQERADFDKAISELQEAVRLGLDNRADLIKAYLYLGFAYIGKGQRLAAEDEFAKAIRLDPTLSLDPKIYSSKLVSVFNDTKSRLVSSLTVISIPSGAEVYVDGQRLGATPVKLNDVLVGEHVIEVVKEYFLPESLSFWVKEEQENRLQVQLDKKEVELLLTSQPDNAIIYIASKGDLDARPYGETPARIKMTLEQELNIKLAKENMDKELTVKLTEKGFSLSGVEGMIPVKDGVGTVSIALDLAPPPGSLNVISDPPDAIVQLDGVTMGKTPVTIAKVTPGVRSLRISIPNFDSETRKVEIISGKETAVQVTLGGGLHILSVPGSAQVFMNGEYMGITPFRTGKVPTGSYQLRLTKEKHRDKLSTVVVEKGQDKEVKFRLLPIKGSIAVTSDPPGAHVYLDGESKGETPVFIYGVLIGQHNLKLVKEGYEDWEKQIVVEELKVSWQFGRMSLRASAIMIETH